MRVAALAFGVLAGLVASFILALGGLDVAVGTPERQAQILRFGLFVIGNIGIFGAALVLAAPLAGAILLLLGAGAWVGAALYLHHTTDLVLVTPPALLLLAAILGLIGHLRRPRDAAGRALDAGVPPMRAALPQSRGATQDPEPQDFEELPPTPVGAGFFRDHAPSQTARVDTGQPVQPAMGGLDTMDQVRSPLTDKWEPRKRPPPPPRQRPMFRDDDEDDDEEESGFARFGRAAASILSFGLYAGLAAAAVLVFWSFRNTDLLHPAVAKIEPPASSSLAVAEASSSEAVLSPILPSSAEAISSLPPISSIAAASSSAAPANDQATFVADNLGGTVVADDAFASSVALGLTFGSPSASEPPASATSSAEPSSSSEQPRGEVGDTSLPVLAVVPAAMPLEMAAIRAGIKPPARPAAPAGTAPANTNNTGL